MHKTISKKLCLKIFYKLILDYTEGRKFPEMKIVKNATKDTVIKFRTMHHADYRNKNCCSSRHFILPMILHTPKSFLIRQLEIWTLLDERTVRPLQICQIPYQKNPTRTLYNQSMYSSKPQAYICTNLILSKILF